jgi:hypothetical protein
MKTVPLAAQPFICPGSGLRSKTASDALECDVPDLATSEMTMRSDWLRKYGERWTASINSRALLEPVRHKVLAGYSFFRWS